MAAAFPEGNVKWQEAVDATASLRPHTLSRPYCQMLEPGPASLLEIPMSQLPANSSCKWFIDVISDIDAINADTKENVAKICREGRLHDLPAPWGLKASACMGPRLQH